MQPQAEAFDLATKKEDALWRESSKYPSQNLPTNLY